METRNELTGPGPVHLAERSERRSCGFTMIEMMIALVLIGILAALAYPSYHSYVVKTGRSDAYTALLDLATRQERFFAEFNTYTAVIVAPGGCSGAACGLKAADVSGDGFYDLTSEAGASGSLATSYKLTATAKAGQRQASDAGCTVLTVDSLSDVTPPECW